MLTLGAAILLSVLICSKFLSPTISESFTTDFTLKLLLSLIPTIIMLSALNIMFFELCNNIVSGILMHFFVSLCLCYISGCLYPIYTFPDIIVSVSKFLPTGMARAVVSTAFAKNNVIPELLGMLIYTLLFLFATYIVRNYKSGNKRRVI